MNTIVHHESLSIEVEYDQDEGQKGSLWVEPIEPSLDVCDFKIEDTDTNMVELLELVFEAIDDDFEDCNVFTFEGNDVIVVDYYGIMLEIVCRYEPFLTQFVTIPSQEDAVEIISYSILDTEDNTEIVHELLEADLTDNIL